MKNMLNLQVSPQKCAVTAQMGKVNCPEEGVHEIDKGVFICEKCLMARRQCLESMFKFSEGFKTGFDIVKKGVKK